MNYWIDLYTETTWEESQNAGASTSGFPDNEAHMVRRIQPSDILLCYVTGIMRWVGALQVLGPSNDNREIWHERDFPVRLQVKPILVLKPEEGVPMRDLVGWVTFYPDQSAAPGYRSVLRRSPTLLKSSSDGETILSLLHEQELHPVWRPVERKKSERRLYPVRDKPGKNTPEARVSVPDLEPRENTCETDENQSMVSLRQHTYIQYELMDLGQRMGLDLWVANNDRSQVCNGHKLGQMSGVLTELPTQFNEATQRTIELIDVLWLKNNTIVAAFEVEDTTSVYSGLLRMSDLLALQPNLNIELYLVAPDERREKVRQEMLRPTFRLREKPLGTVCGYISYSKLQEQLDGITRLGLASSLKPKFVKDLAEYFVD